MYSLTTRQNREMLWAGRLAAVVLTLILALSPTRPAGAAPGE